MQVIPWFFVALAVSRTSAAITGRNYNAKWNGFGVIGGVLNRNIDAPMVYRVLIPWIIGAFEKIFGYSLRRRLILYELVRVLLLTGVFIVCSMGIGRPATLIVACLLPMTFCFDYWDWIIELGAFAACLTGNIWLACVGVALLAMSRETWILCPLIYYLSATESGELFIPFADKEGGAGQISALFVIGFTLWWTIKGIQGDHPLYCDRTMLRRNWRELKELFQPTAWFVREEAMTLLVCGLGIAALAARPPAWQAGVLVLISGWVFGVAQETRVFCPLLLWIGMVGAKYICA